MSGKRPEGVSSEMGVIVMAEEAVEGGMEGEVEV